MDTLDHIQQTLTNLLKAHQDVFKITKEDAENFEVSGTVEAMQGRKKVDGIYFASIVRKPRDIRFYFFPIYTHKDKLPELSESLEKCLKGKSCFHFKKMDESMTKSLKELIQKSVEVYQAHDLLAKA